MFIEKIFPIDCIINFYYIISMDFKSFQQREKLTQTDIADRLSVKQATVSSWATNKTSPTIRQMKQLIFMGMTIGEIFDAETEAFVLKGRRINKRKMSADVVETALASLVNGDGGKINDRDTCMQIVRIGLEELYANKAK